MAPGRLDEPQATTLGENGPSPVKASPGLVDVLEANVSVDGFHSIHPSSFSGNGQTSNGNHAPSPSPASRHEGDERIVPATLLEHSRNFATAGSGPKASTKPNLLYIMADQMTASMLKHINPNSVVKTPHMDELARTGVVFSNAYCNSPLCAPSRFTMCTGQLPSKIAGYDNASEFSSEIPTYAHYLRNEGYETVLAGKMHFIGADQLHGFERRLTSDIYPGDFGWGVNWDEPEVRLEWYHNMSSVMQAGPCVRSNQLDYDEDVMHKAGQYLYEWVRDDPQKRRPFALTVSLTHPHDPYTMTQEYWDKYEGVDIPMPEVHIPQDQQDEHSKRLLKTVDLWDNPVPEEAVKRARRAYFAACTFVDDQIGKLRTILKNCGVDKNTIIVFSGDHGDMLGERDMWYKMSWFENSARVPMIINYPAQFEPKRVAESVSTMDLLPTFIDLVNGDASQIEPIDGVSLYDYLVSNKPGKDEVFGEYMGEGTVTPVVMIRRGRWKFTTSLVDEPQLFDLVNDPKELRNLVHSSKPEHAEVLQRFKTEAAEKWDFNRIHHDVVKRQRWRRKVWKALSAPGTIKTSWDYQPPYNDQNKFIRSHMDLDDLERRARFPEVDYLGRPHTATASHHGVAGARGE